MALRCWSKSKLLKSPDEQDRDTVALFSTFAILVHFTRSAFENWSQQWFRGPERAWPLVDLRHGESVFAEATLGPGAGEGRVLVAVPHLLLGLERAKSSFLSRGDFIAGLVPAADHRLRGEAVHICDHPQLRPNPPDNCPYALSPVPKPPTPPSCKILTGQTLECIGRWGGVSWVVGLGSLPLAPKLLKGFSSYFWGGRMKVCATHRGPNPPPHCLLLLFLCFLSLFQGSYWRAWIFITKEGRAQCQITRLNCRINSAQNVCSTNLWKTLDD